MDCIYNRIWNNVFLWINYDKEGEVKISGWCCNWKKLKK